MMTDAIRLHPDLEPVQRALVKHYVRVQLNPNTDGLNAMPRVTSAKLVDGVIVLEAFDTDGCGMPEPIP